MKQTAGKTTFGTLIFLLVVFFCGFVLVKYILSELQVKQISGQIIDTFGPERRAQDFTQEKAIDMVCNILKDNNIDPTDAAIDVQFTPKLITFQVDYEKKIDYILFKQKKKYSLSDSMDRYGM